MNGISIRPMRATDAPAVLAIYQAGLDSGDASFEVMRWLRDDADQAYDMMSDVTGVDYGHGRPVEVVYKRDGQEQRVSIERGDIEIVGILGRNFLHRVAIGTILLDPLAGLELLDVAHGHGVDEGPLYFAGASLHARAVEVFDA